MENRLNGTKIAVIIPAYNVEKHILEVISTLPSYISFIHLHNAIRKLIETVNSQLSGQFAIEKN